MKAGDKIVVRGRTYYLAWATSVENTRDRMAAELMRRYGDSYRFGCTATRRGARVIYGTVRNGVPRLECAEG